MAYVAEGTQWWPPISSLEGNTATCIISEGKHAASNALAIWVPGLNARPDSQNFSALWKSTTSPGFRGPRQSSFLDQNNFRLEQV